MEPDIQVKFLRALEQRSFRRLGGKKEVSVDIRVVAATNKNVEDAVKDGKLREDLYHRLAVIPIYLPPLRDRGPDVRILAEEFLRRFTKEQDKNIKGFTEGAIALIERYRWPGNVSELKNALERAVILSRGESRHRAVVEVDPRRWGPEGAIHVACELKVPPDAPRGPWTLSLHLADPSPTLRDDGRYAIRLANEDVPFDERSGWNTLAEDVEIR